MSKWPDDVFIVTMTDSKGIRNDFRRCFTIGEIFHFLDYLLREHRNCRWSEINIYRKRDDA